MYNLVNNLLDIFHQHTIKFFIGMFGIVIGVLIVVLGSVNVHRNLHHESSYTVSEVAVSANSNMSVNSSNTYTPKKYYQHEQNQPKQMRIWHIEKSAQNMNKIGCKHGVKRISYNPKTNRLNIKFNTPNPTNYQKKYAHKLLNRVND